MDGKPEGRVRHDGEHDRRRLPGRRRTKMLPPMKTTTRLTTTSWKTTTDDPLRRRFPAVRPSSASPFYLRDRPRRVRFSAAGWLVCVSDDGVDFWRSQP